MIASLRSQKLEKPLNNNDEIITPAVTFPTTLAPIIQNNFVPVFIDCDVQTLNIIPEFLDDAISSKTKALFIPHTLGNPNYMDEILKIAQDHNLYILEDCCDALGGRFNGNLLGTFGDMASLSFYPAHQITTGEGGGVIVNNPEFSKIILSLRDWGRDCWCKPGQNNSCGQRFSWQLGNLPYGFDHKYIYSHIGYNLKATEMQAAIGLAQLEKLEDFLIKRRENFTYYFENLSKLSDYLILPKWHEKSEPSWFGFPIITKDGVDTYNLMTFLEKNNIETRKIFAGNILLQPGFLHIKHRIYGNLNNSNQIMENGFFIGVYPGLTEGMLSFVIEKFYEYFGN
jgi:CDP-6-deoxy-D-xylo-4-hexulose-3-dehydrase